MSILLQTVGDNIELYNNMVFVLLLLIIVVLFIIINNWGFIYFINFSSNSIRKL